MVHGPWSIAIEVWEMRGWYLVSGFWFLVSGNWRLAFWGGINLWFIGAISRRFRGFVFAGV